MRSAILALTAFGILFGMWLVVGVRILRETTAIIEAAAAACIRRDHQEDVGLAMAGKLENGLSPQALVWY